MVLSLDILNSNKDSIFLVTKLVNRTSTIVPYKNSERNAKYQNLGLQLTENIVTRSFLVIHIDGYFFEISTSTDNKYKFVVNPNRLEGRVFYISPIIDFGGNLEKLSFEENINSKSGEISFTLNIDPEYYNELINIFTSYVNEYKNEYHVVL